MGNSQMKKGDSLKRKNNNRVAKLGDGGWEMKTNRIESKYVKKVNHLISISTQEMKARGQKNS